jgi:superfamily II DNA or RNA helicase
MKKNQEILVESAVGLSLESKTIESRNGILAILEALKSDNLTAQTEAVKEGVNKNLYISKLIEELEIHLKENYFNLRKNQKRTLNRLVLFLKAGKLDGLIKQPTGAGKTRIIAETARAFSEPSVILVPRTALVGQTYTEMVGDDEEDIDGIGFDETEVSKIDEQGKTSAFQVRRFLEATKESKKPISLIITYQSLVSLEKGDKATYEELMDYIQIFHTDEAHRSLGEKTQEALNVNEDEEELTQEEEKDEDSALELIKKNKKLFLRYTATPKLSQKEVLDVFDTEIIDWLKIQELVEDGVLILPQHKNVGTFVANINKDELTKSEHISSSFLQSLSENDRFVEEGSGLSLNEVHLRDYKEIKELNDGYAPGVAYCATVKEAEERMKYFQANGIRCKRCTSDVKGVDPTDNVSDVEAKKMLNKDEVDLIFTVTKVAEGWDVPTLRTTLWFTPSKSPARIIQANGRIMRSLRANSPHPAKSSENTWILEPTFMVRYSKNTDRKGHGVKKGVKGNTEEFIGLGEDPLPQGPEERNKYESQSFWQMLVDNDEFDADSLKKLNPNVEIQYPFDFSNNEHLLTLIGTVDALIANGQGVNLLKQVFENSDRGWKFSGGQIGNYLFDNSRPGVTESESLARMLDPKRAEKLIINWESEEHLRLLIGEVGNLIKNGKGVNLQSEKFENKEKNWSMSGNKIGAYIFDTKTPNSGHAELLAKRLWSEEANELLPNEEFDFNNDEHLRLLIGEVGNLIKNGKGVNLQSEKFENKEKNWSMSGNKIGAYIFDTRSPNSEHAELLAKKLWPRGSAELLFSFDNDEHLRLLIGDVNNLIKNGKGVNLQSEKFENKEKDWSMSGGQIGRAIFDTKQPNSAHAELLAKRLWPEEANELLPNEEFDFNNDEHLRLLMGEVGNLIKNGKGVNLVKAKFINKEKDWSMSGGQIGRAIFDTSAPKLEHAELLAKRLWPRESAELLFSFDNYEHLRLLIGEVGNLIKNGKGVNLVKAKFINKERAWSMDGGKIGRAVFDTSAPNSEHAELLARRLWPEEVEKLLRK